MQRATRLMMFCAGLALLGATACETADPNSAAYWIEKLKGDNPKAAVRKLGEIDSPEATDALVAYYKEGRFRYDIVAALTRKGDHKAVPVLVEALQDTQEPKAAQLAASTLLEWKAGEGYTDTYVAVISNASAPNENRYGALQILAANPDPKATQPLLAILKSDPDIVPIVMIGLAAEALGKLGAEEAIPGLIRCLWLDDALGRNEVAACRLALNRVGPAKAVPKLIQTLERKNRTVEQRARKYKFDLGGIVEAKTAEMLGDMPDPSAVDPLIKALTTSDQMPPSIANDPKKAQVFVMSGVQKVISVANALAIIGDERAVDPLMKVAADKELALEHKLAAVQQLAFLGSTKAIPDLMTLLTKEVNQYDPVSQGFRVQVALAIANLLDGSDEKTMAKFQKAIDDIKKGLDAWIADNNEKIGKVEKPELKQALAQDIKGYEEQKGNFGEVEAKLAVVRECKADVACLAGKLEAKEDAIRLLAAYRLAQTKGDAVPAARDALVKVAGTEDLVLRNVVFFGLDRLGDASIIPAMEKIRAADDARAEKDKRYKGAVYTTDLLIAKLKHKKG